MYLDYFTYFLYCFATFFVIYLIIFKRDYIKEHQGVFLFFLVGILLFSQYDRYLAKVFTVNFSFSWIDIPTGYCRVSAVLAVIFIFTKNKYLGGFLYFQAGLGFFSVIFPGGNFFVLTESHRNLGYVYDHFVLAILPFIIIFISNIKITKKMMYFSIAYSLIIPFALLPYALSSGRNVYYILDGVFIPLVFGDNQIVISIVYIIGTVLYNYLMYLLAIWLMKINEKENLVKSIFKPIYPWIVLGSFTIIGIIIGSFVSYNIPNYIIDTADSYTEEPYKHLDTFAYVYEGLIDDKTVYFIEIIDKYEEVVVMDDDGNFIPLLSSDNVYYYYKEDVLSDNVIILLYKNKGEDDVKVNSYSYLN